MEKEKLKVVSVKMSPVLIRQIRAVAGEKNFSEFLRQCCRDRLEQGLSKQEEGGNQVGN